MISLNVGGQKDVADYILEHEPMDSMEGLKQVVLKVLAPLCIQQCGLLCLNVIVGKRSRLSSKQHERAGTLL
jgi:hypothetical protein